MATDVLNAKLHWVLSIADKVQQQFTNESHLNQLRSVFERVAADNNAILIHGLIACNDYPFMLIANEPRKALVDFVDAIRAIQSKTYQETLNPVSLCPQLGDLEWLLSMGNERVCYAIAAQPSNYILKAFTCRRLSTVLGYDKYINSDTMRLPQSVIKEIHPDYDYQTAKIAGGRLKNAKSKTRLAETNKIKLRMTITAQLIEFIRNTPSLSSGIIFVNELEDSSSSAISLIFTERKYKDAIMEYLRKLVEDEYNSFTFRSYLNANLNVPYDFRMKKFSALINNKSVKQCVCLLHMYNIATYDPMPCIRQCTGETMIQIAHPLVRLRLLYTDIYFAQKKLGQSSTIRLHSRLVSVYDEVEAYNKYPTWIGFFVNEAFAKNKRAKNQPELLLI